MIFTGCFLLSCASKLKSLAGNPSIRRYPSFYHQSRPGRATGRKLRGSAPPQGLSLDLNLLTCLVLHRTALLGILDIYIYQAPNTFYKGAVYVTLVIYGTVYGNTFKMYTSLWINFPLFLISRFLHSIEIIYENFTLY